MLLTGDHDRQGDAAGPVPPVSHNLQGQRLGRKGRDTRERILAAAHELLAEPVAPGSTITLSEVARRAKLRVGSLYLYFADLTELLLALLAPVMEAAENDFVRLLRPRWSEEALGARTLDLVTAYYAFWVRHSRLLHLRNSMADSLDERMLRHRVRSVQPIMRLLVEQMDGDASRPEPAVAAMATAMMTGLERVVTVTTDPNLPLLIRTRDTAGHRQLLEAQARLIELGIQDCRRRAGGKHNTPGEREEGPGT
ncbi:MAG: TetR/AcrR family transcriptional regulator [Novosphingobium sp.]